MKTLFAMAVAIMIASPAGADDRVAAAQAADRIGMRAFDDICMGTTGDAAAICAAGYSYFAAMKRREAAEYEMLGFAEAARIARRIVPYHERAAARYARRAMSQ